jgi:hypothetical protein
LSVKDNFILPEVANLREDLVLFNFHSADSFGFVDFDDARGAVVDGNDQGDGVSSGAAAIASHLSG